MEQPVIPVRNIYYMLTYAWGYLQEIKQANLEAIPGNNLLDILGYVLNKGVLQLSRRGLELDYNPNTEIIPGIKGRIEFAKTIRGFHLNHGKTVSTFDMLNEDTPANRIIKSTLAILIKHEKLNSTIRDEARSLYRKLPGISTLHLTPQHFSYLNGGKNTRYYKFVISVCKFIVNNSIPGQNKGHYRFYDFERNEKEMSLLYQKFLYEFCRRELTPANTTRSYLKWDASSISDQSLNLLPRMETDITIRSSEKILIVDAKYYKSIFSRRMGTEKFHSQNLYQLMNYLWSLKPENGENIGGLLIYPHVDTAVKHRYKINGFDIGLCTVNLGQEWPCIHQELLDIFDEYLK